ncbi:TetR/AcrR family transcriptional regulator [Paenibacillus sp. DYY-L-2]|uniref:TetR/AcrR family transcriptional regulator n=1 Tax=Paenibacillus sp. DYY-L-2 TaxID=3447013 RepID=UPI003F500A76
MLTPKGEASKSKLIASAEELFARKGFHATTVSQIVKNAGLTQASYYLYFKSKDEILREMLHRFEEQLLPYSDAGRYAGGKSAAELEAFVVGTFTGLFRLLGSNANLTRIVFQDTEGGSLLRDKIVKLIASNMMRNKQSGLIRAEVDPEVAAESVVASVERLVHRYISTGEKDAEELGRQTRLLFLQGVLNHDKK